MAVTYFGSGRIATDTPANLIMLVMSGGSTAPNNFETLRVPTAAGGAGYQVPAGLTLTIIGFTAAGQTASYALEEIGYADTSIANSATRPATAVYFIPRMVFGVGTTPFIPLVFRVPALKYPYATFGAIQAGLNFIGYVA